MREQRTIPMFSPYMHPSAIERVGEVLHTPMIGQGAIVADFEEAIRKKRNLSYVIAVNNSASAIRLALDLANVQPGDEVITTPLTCTLTNHPILEQFATPVFADVQRDTGNIDPVDVERRITPKTKAIVCTHWGGMPCDLAELNIVARRNNIPVIEDASEAFSAHYQGRPVGVHSRFVAFSFHAIQSITSTEGGALVLQLEVDAAKARMKRWYGIDRTGRKPNVLGYYDFDVNTIGYGYYLTNVAAAVGIENLQSLDSQIEHRQRIADIYSSGLGEISGLQLLAKHADRTPAFHFFTVLVEQREEFCKKMNAVGIRTSIVHERNDNYSIFGGLRQDLPNLDYFSERYIGLPVHMGMTEEDAHYVVESISEGW